MDSVAGKTRLIQETDLPRLPYLQAVVKETQRFHPAVPLTLRMSEEDCNVGGFHIPEKTTLVVNVYAVMRDPNVWQNPDEFKQRGLLLLQVLSKKKKERKSLSSFLLEAEGEAVLKKILDISSSKLELE